MSDGGSSADSIALELNGAATAAAAAAAAPAAPAHLTLASIPEGGVPGGDGGQEGNIAGRADTDCDMWSLSSRTSGSSVDTTAAERDRSRTVVDVDPSFQ